MAADGSVSRSLSWRQLEQDIAALAAGLQSAGVGSHSRVSLMVPPGVDLTVVLYACLRLGAVVVVADAGLGIRGLSRAVKGATPDFLIGIDKALAAAAVLGWPGRRISVRDLPPARRRLLAVDTSLAALARRGTAASQEPPAPDTTPDRTPDADAPAAVLFTSGSTGPAKGVLYTHRQLAAMRDTVAATLEIRPGARLVAGFAPFALLGPALGAVSVTPAMDVTAPRTLTARALAAAAAAIDATVVFASPAALRNVLATKSGLDRAGHDALGRVELVLSAGAPVPEPLLAQVQRLVPRASLHTPYGMTEALPVTDISLEQIRAAEADAAAGTMAGAGNGVCVGLPVHGARVAVIPLAADGTAPGTGSVTDAVTDPAVTGEILVNAPHVKEAYDRLWLTQMESDRTPGWHRTGDVGHFDAAGRLWVEGRLAHVVTAPGTVVTPVGAEQAIEGLAEVGLAAVVGVGPSGTQAVVAVVETVPPGRRAGPAAPELAGRVRDAARRAGCQRFRCAHGPFPADRHPPQRQNRQDPAVPLGHQGAGRRPSGHAVRVLVTGASGLLGRAVAALLVGQGHDVTTFQRRPSGVDGAADVLGSVTDDDAVRRAAVGAQGVIHLAAKVSFTGRAAEFDEVNVEGTRRLLRAARSAGVRDLVFVSSPSVANSGAAIAGLGAEPADPLRAHGDYSRTKAEAELLALAADSPEVRVAAVRPHIVWGPGDTQLVERVLERAARGRLPLLDAGAALIDTTYIDNAASAIAAALHRMAHIHGRALVVSNGEPRPVGELLAGICAAGGVPAPSWRVPGRLARAAGSVVEKVWTRTGRAEEPPMTRFLAEQLSTAHWFDQRETRELLDWTPSVSLDDGLRRLADYYQRPFRGRGWQTGQV